MRLISGLKIPLCKKKEKNKIDDDLTYRIIPLWL